MRRDGAVAAGWGLAEATLWFVVPDVFLTWVVLRRGMRPGLRLAVLAVAGAVVGGLLTYSWGALWPDTGATAMTLLPGIDAGMVERVAGEVSELGSAALLNGPRRAQPYKLYALAAGEQGASFVALALWTIPGRALRFVLSVVGAGIVRSVGRRFLSERVLLGGWAIFWTGVYLWLWVS